jgi:hypothetical protein
MSSAEAEDSSGEFAVQGSVCGVQLSSVRGRVGLWLWRGGVPFYPVCGIPFANPASEPCDGDG